MPNLMGLSAQFISSNFISFRSLCTPGNAGDATSQAETHERQIEVDPQQHNALKLLERLWELVLEKTQDQIESIIKEPWDVIFFAAELGNVEFVKTLFDSYPDIIWKLNSDDLSIFHVAVMYRQEEIFKLIYDIGAIKDIILFFEQRGTGNTILHLAAKYPPLETLNNISGAALRMRREMLWFKMIKDVVRPDVVEKKNRVEGNEETAFTLFTKEHKELREAGEEWMRKTAGSCSVVAALIVSSVLAFILKVPQNNGVSLSNPPRYNAWNWVFAVFDSLSLITSTTSLLVFLLIMISRYAEEDFLYSLPRKLIIGLVLLFLSIMSIALTTTFHILVNQGWPWFGIIILVLITIILFTQELSLMREIFSSTMGSTSTFQSPAPTLHRTSSDHQQHTIIMPRSGEEAAL